MKVGVINLPQWDKHLLTVYSLAARHVPLLAVCNVLYFYVACLPILCFYDHYLFVVGFDGLNSLCLNNDMRAVVCRPSTANP